MSICSLDSLVSAVTLTSDSDVALEKRTANQESVISGFTVIHFLL